MRQLLAALALIACTALFSLADGAVRVKEGAEGRAVPRYGLQAGQELTYKTAYDFVHDESVTRQSKTLQPGDGFGDHGTTTIWITGSSDKGWQAVLRASSTPYSRRGGRAEEQKAKFDVMSFVVSDSGQILTDDPGADDFRLEDYFPRLPDDEAAARDGWTSENPRLARSYRLQPVAQNSDRSDEWAFDINVDDSMNRLVLASQTGRAVFDKEQALIATFDAEYKQ